MGILLAILATLLMEILSPFLVLYAIIRLHNLKKISEYFFKIAVSKDQLGNVVGGPFFNDVCITKDGYKFGNEDETISSVHGRNYQTHTLKGIGKSIRFYLDRVEKDHCTKSIGS